MQLATTISFIVLLCSLFGTSCPRIIIANKNFKEIMINDIRSPIHHSSGNVIRTSLNSCRSGVVSVSTILFTSDNLPQGNYININESCKLFNPLKPVIILSHGFISTPYTHHFIDLASRLVQKSYTVLSLDWTDASCYNDPLWLQLLYYSYAAENSHEVGNRLASIIKSLIDVCKIPLSNIKLMGHSLGAHVSSFACKNLQKSGYGKPPLVIGTDPAAPLFEDTNCTDKFCESDAKRVIVLHTSTLGIQYSLGDYDIWFNNGFDQPACGSTIDNVCSHNIAIVYLIVMLDNAFIGIPIERRTTSIHNPKPGCSSNTTNCIDVDNRIFNNNYNTTGDYCVSVTDVYPYFTTTNSTCQ